MNFQTKDHAGSCSSGPASHLVCDIHALRWYAVLTIPQHEKTTVKHLDVRNVESFLPIYEKVSVWKNRQRKTVSLPLFPTYLFVHIAFGDRPRVLQAPGVLQIVGNGKSSIPLPDSEIEFLRASLTTHEVEPYRELVMGEKVYIKSGPMRGAQGTLVRKSSGARFILTLELINQHASIQVNAEDIEPLVGALPLYRCSPIPTL